MKDDKKKRDFWLQLFASWNVDVKRSVVCRNAAAFDRVIRLFGNYKHPLYNCPMEPLGNLTVMVPKLAVRFLSRKDTLSITTSN